MKYPAYTMAPAAAYRRFTKESSFVGHCLLPLSCCSPFQLPFQTHATEEKAGYFMTQEPPPGKGSREERCLVAGVIRRHLASLAATSGTAESASSKGVERPAPVESCTQSGTAAG